MAPSNLPIHISCLFLSLICLTPCGMSRTPSSSPSTADFWHKFCSLFCPFPAGCSPDVYLSMQQKQMLLERQGLLATLQSFPQLLQDSDKLQHTALVTLEEHQRALVLMRYKDFFHPRETLPSATVKPSPGSKVAASTTVAPEVHTDTRRDADIKSGFNKAPPVVEGQEQAGHNVLSQSHIRRHVNASTKSDMLTRTADVVKFMDNTIKPHVDDDQNTRFDQNNNNNNHNNLISEAAQVSMHTLTMQSYKWNETNNIDVEMENNFDILKFQQILSAIPDVVLFNALCKKCAASARQNPVRHGRKLLRLILQNGSSEGNAVENNHYVSNTKQEYDRNQLFRTHSKLFNSIGRPGGAGGNYIEKAIAYIGESDDTYNKAPGVGKITTTDHELGSAETLIRGLPEYANYRSIADQFRRAEEARHQQHAKRRRKRTVMKTQVCPVVQSWSNLVLAKTANGTLVQIAQFPEVNLEQWFLEEKCKYPISPILDDVTCESRERLVDAVIIPVSNPTLPIQMMKIKIQCCVSMYNLDDGRNN